MKKYRILFITLVPSLLFCKIEAQAYFIDTLRIDICGQFAQAERYQISLKYSTKDMIYDFTVEPNQTVLNTGTIFIPINDTVRPISAIILTVKKKKPFFWRETEIIVLHKRGDSRCLFIRNNCCNKTYFDYYWESEVPISTSYWYPHLISDTVIDTIPPVNY